MQNALIAALGKDFHWAQHLHYYESVTSTNLLAKEMAAKGAPHGTVLLASHQTAGRGRLGRSFQSPEHAGVYMSVILRPNCPPAQLMHLTCAVAVAMCDAVDLCAKVRPGIKWTNDLVVGNKKLGGILTALCVGAAGTVDWAIVGIGINCAATAFPKELEGIDPDSLVVKVTEEDIAQCGKHPVLAAVPDMEAQSKGGYYQYAPVTIPGRRGKKKKNQKMMILKMWRLRR